jgi:hypothetical protein
MQCIFTSRDRQGFTIVKNSCSLFFVHGMCTSQVIEGLNSIFLPLGRRADPIWNMVYVIYLGR